MKQNTLMLAGWTVAVLAASPFVSAQEVLVDFVKESDGMRVGAGAYADPARQRLVTADGLTIFFDAASQKTPSSWMTLVIPTSVGGRVDWTLRPFELVLRGVPTGRALRNIALNFEDRDGETFQIYASESRLDERGDLHLAFLLNPARSFEHSGVWGGGAKANKRMDGPMYLSALNVHFSSKDSGDGEATFRRIVARECATTARNVETREAISVDTGYPGAAPFPGAETLAFRVKPAYTGTATLVLSTESTGSASQGRMIRLNAAVTNGVVRLNARLPYEKQYEFMRLEHHPDAASPKGPFEIVSAEGVFRQTAAEAMRLEVDTKNVLHIARDVSERPELLVSNPAAVPQTWKTTFRGTDVFGRSFAVPFDRTVAAGETVRVELPWPLPAKGLWRVSAEVTGADGSVAKKETRFAYIDRHDVTPKLEKPKFRMGIHYHGSFYLPNRVEPTIAALVAAGAKFTRTDYSLMFSHVCPKEGVESWETGDLMVRKMRAAGLALDIIIHGAPSWAWDPNGAWTKTNVTRRVGCRPMRPGLFRDFCEKFARRYAGQIDYYEVGNEWDIVPGLNLTHDEALRMQREGYEGVHAGDPKACVTPNGWAAAVTDPEWNKDLAHTNPGLIECFARHPELYDAWALHCHGSAERYYRQIDEQFLPMYNSTPLRTRPWLSNETALTSAYGEEDTVARAVWMKILFAWSRGARDYIWYNLRATGWFDGGEPGYGLITCDFHPRAGYAAFAALTAVFEGLDFDAILHSKGLRHLLRFKGTKEGFGGIVLAGWDTGDEKVVRTVRIATDAARAALCDHMGNRTSVEVRDGVASFSLAFEPRALLLEGATRAELVDRGEIERDDIRELFARRDPTGTQPLFQLNAPRHVKDAYAADPSMTHRIWKGPADHAARIWLESAEDGGVRVKAEVVDDIRAAGDGLEVFLTGRDGQKRTFALKPLRRAGNIDHYDAVLPFGESVFGFDVHVLEDDGDGADGYLQLRNESEKPLRVRLDVAPVTSSSLAPVPPYGVVTDATRSEYGMRDELFRLAEFGGMNYVRVDWDMRVVKPTKDGPYDFSKYDAFVDEAEKRGLTVLPILYGTPDWASPVWEHLEAYEDFCRATVAHYAGRMPAVEVWNEPNIPGFWYGKAPNASNYVAVLRAAWRGVKAVDPAVRVVFGGMAGWAHGYIEDCYKAGMGGCFDVMCVHPYTYPFPVESSHDRALARLREIMARYGDARKPIWYTEIGWPTHDVDISGAGNLIEAGLRVALAGKATWKVLYADCIPDGQQGDPDITGTLLEHLPAGSQVRMCGPKETVRLLGEGGWDAVVYPPDESFPVDTLPAVEKFVREGGTLVDLGGMPMWNPYRNLPEGGSSRTGGPYSWDVFTRLRIGCDSWWIGKSELPKNDHLRVYATPEGVAAGVKMEPTGLPCGHFFTDRLLKPGDRWVPLVKGTNPNNGKDAVAACVYLFENGMKGRCVISGISAGRGASFKVDESMQARYYVRALAFSMAQGIEAFFYYSLRARERDRFYSEDNFGVVHANLAPKPAFLAHRVFARMRPAGSVNQPGAWRRGTLFFPQWTRPDGTGCGVLWDVSEKAEARPLRFAGEVKFFDLYGKPLPVRKLADAVWQVPVSGAPVYFTGGALQMEGGAREL